MAARQQLSLQQVGTFVVDYRCCVEPAPLPQGNGCRKNPGSNRQPRPPAPVLQGGKPGGWDSSEHEDDSDKQHRQEQRWQIRSIHDGYQARVR